MAKNEIVFTREEKYIEIRNELINEVVVEMGPVEAQQYFSVPENRQNIEEIARTKTRVASLRDLSIQRFTKRWVH